VTLRKEMVNTSLGSSIYKIDNYNVLFVSDNKEIKNIFQYAKEILPFDSDRNLSIDRISATLISYLVLNWTFDKTFLPSLYISTDGFNLKTKTIKQDSKKYSSTNTEADKIQTTKNYVITPGEVKRNNHIQQSDINLYKWYKIDDGIGDKKSDLFIKFGDLLRDVIPHKGWTRRNTSIFVKDASIESPVFENSKAIVSCPDCGKKCRVDKLKKIMITCPKCSCIWKQRLY
jgi:hypothetical protein